MVVLLVAIALLACSPLGAIAAPDCTGAVDYADLLGGLVRQIKRPEGSEHNFYYLRNPFNANNTLMTGVRENLTYTSGEVVLYDGHGCYLQTLWPLFIDANGFRWPMVWHPIDPNKLYGYTASQIIQFTFSPPYTQPPIQTVVATSPFYLSFGTTVSMNQAGTRIGIVTGDGTTSWMLSWDLSGQNMQRMNQPPYPPGCGDLSSGSNVWRYTGYQDVVAMHCDWDGVTGVSDLSHTWFCNMAAVPVGQTKRCDDPSVLIKEHTGLSISHTSFSPDGRWAFPYPRYGVGLGVDISVMGITENWSPAKIVFSTDNADIRNVHVSWPRANTTRFVFAVFPYATASTPGNDYLYLCQGVPFSCQPQARSFTVPGAGPTPGFDNFWAQPLPAISADGSRVSFNSNRATATPKGTDLDQHILYLPGADNLPPGDGSGTGPRPGGGSGGGPRPGG